MGSNVLFEQIRNGQREGLAKGITIIESERVSDRPAADALLRACLPFSQNALFIGVTGVPGVGKSTLLNALGMWFIRAGHKVAVLAVDPSSGRSKGSILGDKTRMEDLSQQEAAFIRPSPTSGVLGGVSRRTRETAILCAAAGYSHIFIETVGVGQNELYVDDLADLTLLLLLAGAGDELQGIKRGIMEAADVMAINKVEGDNEKPGKRAAMELRNALSLLPPRDSGLRAKVFGISALEQNGIDALAEHITALATALQTQGIISKRRTKRSIQWAGQRVKDALLAQLYERTLSEKVHDIESQIESGSIDPISASEKILALIQKDSGTPS